LTAGGVHDATGGRSPLRRLLRLPRPTVRLRLTLLYGGLFLCSGAVLLTITNLALRSTIDSRAIGPARFTRAPAAGAALAGPHAAGARSALPAQVLRAYRESQQKLGKVNGQLHAVVRFARAQPPHELHSLLVISLVALAVMAVISIGLGWIVAGRVLRPLRTITTTAREISATNLHRRLALAGPDDELHELGDTFDALLGRLEASFEAQRQFVANASHELRTPLTRQRTLAEVALSDPEATVDSLRESHQRVIAAGEQQERLIEALLTLARSDRGLAEREPFDLATLAGRVLAARQGELEQRELALEVALAPAASAGEPRLAERLIANLVDNAIRHNHSGGSAWISTEAGDGEATITVANTGPAVPAGEIDRLLQPFERLERARTSGSGGTGLGLSIAAAVARAHGGALVAEPRPGGGLIVRASLPGP
jgi:signal transduction histidine kinase